MPTLRDWGFDTRPAQLPFLTVTSKPLELRIIEKMPVEARIDAKIPVLARFKVETAAGSCFIWDVSSKRAMAALGELDDISWPFFVAKTGKGTNTIYTIYPKPLPQQDDEDTTTEAPAPAEESS